MHIFWAVRIVTLLGFYFAQWEEYHTHAGRFLHYCTIHYNIHTHTKKREYVRFEPITLKL